MKELTKAGLSDKHKPPKKKVCQTCKAEKPIKEFAKRLNSADGHYHECRACKSDRDKKRSDEKKEYAKNFFTF